MESSKRLIVLLVAGVLVAFIAIAIRARVSTEPVTQEVSQRVMVAKRDISPGSSVAVPQDADWAEVAAEIKNKEGIVREDRNRIEDINGAILRRMVYAGEPIELSMLTRPGGGGLMSAVLEPGMRAVSIAVNATSGNAGFVLPGDYVDLILTRELTRNVNNGRESETRKTVYSKTFVEHVRVLAADQMLDNPENKAMVAKTVTVEVSPPQAQMIAVAAELGKISVALRSAGSTPQAVSTEALPSAVDGKPAAAMKTGTTDADFAGEPNGSEVSEPVRVMRPTETQNLEFYRPPGAGAK